MVKIKVCGITNKEDALRAVQCGAWALGFIFYKKSPRCITPEAAQGIIAALPKKIITVGVFVDAPEDEVRTIAKQCRLRAVQFHGSEAPVFCSRFKGLLTIKAIRVKTRSDIIKALAYKTDLLLFDTYQRGTQGGTGKTFDWDFLNTQKNILKRGILSGGLDPDNIQKAVSSLKAYAFDVASGIERRPGKKCQRLLKKFFAKAKRSA